MTKTFLLKELLRPSFFNTDRVGWVLPNLRAYGAADASTRIRAYDLWAPLNELGVQAELYRPFLSYGAVVFQKSFAPEHLRLAKELKRKGARVLLDINVNYLELDEQFVPPSHREDVKRMLAVIDGLVVASAHLADAYAAAYAGPIFTVEDSLRLEDVPRPKAHAGKGTRLLYCGYAVKAAELELIAPVLRRLHERHGASLVFVCDKDPRFPGVPSEFHPYRQDDLARLLSLGDVKLAPRDLSRPYNLGHSAAKIAGPMAAGLPVVASPVPSYRGTPALLCEGETQWEEALERLIVDPALRSELGARGREHAARHWDAPVVARAYADVLRTRP